jgi:hypothetical protein
VAATLDTLNKKSPFKVRTHGLYAFEPTGLAPLPWSDVKKHFPADSPFSSYADVEGKWDDNSLTLDWKSDLEAVGHSVLPRSKAAEPSDLQAREMNWNDFKTYLDTLQKRHLFSEDKHSLGACVQSFIEQGGLIFTDTATKIISCTDF